MSEQVRVGVAVFVFNAMGKFLIGKRRGSHGAGTWGLPGGHLEFGETVSDACHREVLEETGLSIGLTERAGWSESKFPENGKHYVTLFTAAQVVDAREPILMEPEKCEEWRWVTQETLPGLLFLPLANYFLWNNAPGSW